MHAVLSAVAIVCCAAVASAVLGVDVSQPTSSSSFACLKSHGYDFAVARAFESINAPDSGECTLIDFVEDFIDLLLIPAAPGTVNAAWAAGLAHVDVYM